MVFKRRKGPRLSTIIKKVVRIFSQLTTNFLSLIRHKGEIGTMDLELRWKTALTKPISVIVYLSYDQIVKVPKENGGTIEISYF